MTKIIFSKSVAVATEFAIKLLSGTLNMRTECDNEVERFVESKLVTSDFSTDRIASLRPFLAHMQLSELEISDPEQESESGSGLVEIRHVRAHAKVYWDDKEWQVALYDVCRNYIESDEGGTWSRWRVKNVRVMTSGYNFNATYLIPFYPDPDDSEPIWGTRVEH